MLFVSLSNPLQRSTTLFEKKFFHMFSVNILARLFSCDDRGFFRYCPTWKTGRMELPTFLVSFWRLLGQVCSFSPPCSRVPVFVVCQHMVDPNDLEPFLWTCVALFPTESCPWHRAHNKLECNTSDEDGPGFCRVYGEYTYFWMLWFSESCRVLCSPSSMPVSTACTQQDHL